MMCQSVNIHLGGVECSSQVLIVEYKRKREWRKSSTVVVDRDSRMCSVMEAPRLALLSPGTREMTKERERERETDRERDRQTEREKERERERERQIERENERETDRERDRQRDTWRHRDTETERNR